MPCPKYFRGNSRTRWKIKMWCLGWWYKIAWCDIPTFLNMLRRVYVVSLNYNFGMCLFARIKGMICTRDAHSGSPPLLQVPMFAQTQSCNLRRSWKFSAVERNKRVHAKHSSVKRRVRNDNIYKSGNRWKILPGASRSFATVETSKLEIGVGDVCFFFSSRRWEQIRMKTRSGEGASTSLYKPLAVPITIPMAPMKAVLYNSLLVKLQCSPAFSTLYGMRRSSSYRLRKNMELCTRLHKHSGIPSRKPVFCTFQEAAADNHLVCHGTA